ncbi:LOW QUALITY PROTEIN: myelin-associated oligodendrocyte basic protein [Tursiops truncatus]|uniref:LOW QUALITY PROTEIN: myelin-associated oligodendrocyte basic protein n=2 Tax=Delphinidae TaxID=9726 RepID=A0A2U4CAS1_TURTR|nr:LOW QUALITY PROTEIN: myelin-associated oligodendrocyte basic protein [Tursiops truncatus]XP_030702041.1 LOW QUALITY PROTEIN: myelin-associated oligodendrocyte basic protein [Globicephala melas]
MSQKVVKEGPRLSKNQKFSEHFSIHCCPPFTFLNSKREIVDRKYSICKSGCFYQKKEEDWICCACQKTSSCQHPLSNRGEPLLQPPASFGPLSTSRRATSPQRPKRQPAAPPAVVRAPAKPRSPPRSERQPRPRPEVRPPPAKQRSPQKAKKQPRSSPQKGPGTSRGGSPNKASRFW